jgi:hypothetical protein
MEVLVSISKSDVLYHLTTLSPAAQIVTQDKFYLKPSEGTSAEEALGKGAYYLSTTRTKVGSYTRQHVWSSSVIFVLDGYKLGQSYKIAPVDYWATLDKANAAPYNTDDAYHLRRDRYESEDRVFSRKPVIPAFKYIKEIHCHVNERTHLMFSLKKAALLHGVKIWFYEDTKELMLLNKAKAVPVKFDKSAFAPANRLNSEYDFKYRNRQNSIRPWLELWFAKIKPGQDPYMAARALGGKAYDAFQRLRYADAVHGFSADLHNAKGAKAGDISKEREMLDKLIGIMRTNKFTPKQFLDALFDKYYPRSEAS